MTYADFVSSKLSTAAPKGLPAGDINLGAHLFDHQRVLVRWALMRGRAAIFADTGLGKQQPVSEPVLTPDGWSTMGGLEVGDMVIGSNGLPNEVLGVYPQGTKPVFRIELQDGTFVRAGSEHLWAVRTKVQRYRDQSPVVLTTDEIAQTVGRGWQLPMFTPDDTPDIDLPMDPYTLGVLLGDGSLSGPTSSICTDRWIGESLGWRLKSAHQTCEYVAYYTAPIDISRSLCEMGLRGTVSDTKYVPGSYLIASPAQRLSLLRGLMDTDGHAMPSGGAEFCSTSKQLVDSVASLVRSLGGVARGLRRAAATYLYKGERLTGKPAWRVNIKLPKENPFALPRKASVYVVPTKYQPARIIRRVVDEGVSEPQVCIKVAAKDSLYVTRDYILTHNTAMQLDWARNVSAQGRVLILTPLAVAEQTVREGTRFGLDCVYSQTDTGARITVTNYEHLDKFAAVSFAGVVIDESSILKTHTGAFRNRIISTFQRTPFRLACTATPAPNDHMELGNHSEFLGLKSRTEMLSEYFAHDGGSTQDWRIKGHAEETFWRWVASWGAMIRKPSDLGFDDGKFDLPPLSMNEIVVPVSHRDAWSEGYLFAPDATSLSAQRATRRATLSKRVAEVAKLAAGDNPCLVWCELNDEADDIEAAIPGAVQVKGNDSPEVKADRLLGFADGKYRVLVTKPKIAGFGMNWQHCNRVVFAGASHSFEQTYQAIRRCWRFGQTKPVDVFVIRAETESAIVQNYRRKEADVARMQASLISHVSQYQRQEIDGSNHREWIGYDPKVPMTMPRWL